MSPEQLEEMQVAAAVRMQTMFRGFRARWKVLHPKVFSKGMRDADEHEREESWHRYLRAWQEVRTLPACRTRSQPTLLPSFWLALESSSRYTTQLRV